VEEVSAISRIISSKLVSASRHVIFEFGMCTLARDDELLIRIILFQKEFVVPQNPGRCSCPVTSLRSSLKFGTFYPFWNLIEIVTCSACWLTVKGRTIVNPLGRDEKHVWFLSSSLERSYCSEPAIPGFNRKSPGQARFLLATATNAFQ
jgi:hypothetical protein